MIILSSKIKSYAENGESFDLQDLFFRFTIDSFAKVAFGIDLNSLNDDQQPEFARALNLCQLQVDWRFYQPLWHLEEKYTSRGQEVTRAFALIHQFGQDVIQERRKEYQSDKAGFEKRSDLLALFMKEMDKETDRADANSSVPQVDADDEAPTSIRTSDQDLGMQVLNFVIAARDTTAQALSWCILMLALHPEAEKNLLEEIATGECDIKEDLSYEEIKGMKYANAVFLETLRLYPSVPKNGKRAIKDDVLPDGTIVPAGGEIGWVRDGLKKDLKPLILDSTLQFNLLGHHMFRVASLRYGDLMPRNSSLIVGSRMISSSHRHLSFQRFTAARDR